MNDELALRLYPNRDLTTCCEPVGEDEFGTFELELLCGRLVTMMRTFEGLGLAANQVGVHKRIFAFENQATDGIDRPDVDIPTIFINPQIIDIDETTEEYFKEGCLSFPGTFQKIRRKNYFKMTYRDQSGNHCELGPDVCCGLFGHAFQHELDHLDGKTMLDRADFMEKEKIMKKVNKLRKLRGPK